MDTAGYANYLNVRGASPAAAWPSTRRRCCPSPPRPQQNGSTAFGLHPNLPEVQALFNSGNLAFLANVGTLSQPITRAQYRRRRCPMPGNLFSHADQQTAMAVPANWMASTRPAGPAAWRTTSSRFQYRSRCFRRSPPWQARQFSAPGCKPTLRDHSRDHARPFRLRQLRAGHGAPAGAAAVADLRYRRFADSVRQLDHLQFAGRQQDAVRRAGLRDAAGHRLPGDTAWATS